jgi:hypothetical protein
MKFHGRLLQVWPCIVLAVSAVGVTNAVTAVQVTAVNAKPQVLRVLHPSRTPVGLLYTPETLAQLAETRPSESVPQRIVEAIRQETPIVVMWSLPDSLTQRDDERPPSYPRPYKLAIVEPGGDPTGPDRIEPIWIEQEASVIQQLDAHTAFQEVGAVASFPRGALVPGRELFIYTSEYLNQRKQLVGHRISAVIEWNGAAK